MPNQPDNPNAWNFGFQFNASPDDCCARHNGRLIHDEPSVPFKYPDDEPTPIFDSLPEAERLKVRMEAYADLLHFLVSRESDLERLGASVLILDTVVTREEQAELADRLGKSESTASRECKSMKADFAHFMRAA